VLWIGFGQRQWSEHGERLVDRTSCFLAVSIHPITIFLRCREIGVPQHLLNASHINPGLQMHRGKRVPKNVQSPIAIRRLEICAFDDGLEASQ